MNLYSRYSSMFLCLVVAAITFYPGQTARAQMFSVEEDEPVRNRALTPNTGIYIGLEPAEFDFREESMDNQSLPQPGIYEFDGPLLRIRFETIAFEGYLGVGGGLTGIDDIGYFDGGIKAVRGLRVVRQPTFQLLLPLQLKSSVTSVSNNQAVLTDTQFRQGTFEFGAGGELRLQLGKQFRIRVNAIPNYGFSFATGGIFGGQIFDLETKSRLYADRLFGDIGLSAGWDYSFKRFDVEEDQFDYNLRSVSFILGITF
ncbi:MAG: hypothetical protein R3281_13030 [Balneolaceae bacterium]|nr:hypothetical protein [Balneolaceae bacterium]